MKLPLDKLNFPFDSKPLLVGGRAMEYYGLRPSGADIDLILPENEHRKLRQQYPGHLRDLYGDLGVCIYEFEIWNRICAFKYEDLKEQALEEKQVLVISLEKLLFMKALAMEVPKYHKDLELIVQRIRNDAFSRAQANSPADRT